MSKDPFLEHARLGARSTTLIEYEEIPEDLRAKAEARNPFAVLEALRRRER